MHFQPRHFTLHNRLQDYTNHTGLEVLNYVRSAHNATPVQIRLSSAGINISCPGDLLLPPAFGLFPH